MVEKGVAAEHDVASAREEALAKWLAKLEDEKAALAAVTDSRDAAAEELSAKEAWLMKHADERAAIDRVVTRRAAAERALRGPFSP
jgi:hypothetical protein